MKGSLTVSLLPMFPMFCAAAVLAMPFSASLGFAASSSTTRSNPVPTALDHIGEPIEIATDDDDDDDDFFQVSSDDCGCDHSGDSEFLYPSAAEEQDDEDRDYSNDDRYT